MLSPDDDDDDDDDNDYGKDPRMMQCVLYPVVKLQYTKQGVIFGYSKPITNHEETVKFLYKSLPPMYREQDRLKTASCL